MSCAFEFIMKAERNRYFANQDTYFLENWSCRGLRSRHRFFVAGALCGLLGALA